MHAPMQTLDMVDRPDRRATGCSRCSARRRPRSSRRTFTTSMESMVISELAIDSLGILEIIGSLERRLRIQIPDESLSGIQTIRDLLDEVERRLA